MSVSKKTRFDVFKRDRFTCQYCGRTPPTVILQADHIVPKAASGGDEIDNLITACEDCNQGKSCHPLSEVPPPLDARMQEIQDRREQIEAFNEFLLEQRARDQKVVEDIGAYWFAKNPKPRSRTTYIFARGGSREQSVRTFLKYLPPAEILDAIDVAWGRWPCRTPGKEHLSVWKYFCGVCWRKIRRAEGE